MLRLLLLVWGVVVTMIALAQDGGTVRIKIVSSTQNSLSNASVELLKTDSSLVKISVSDSTGNVDFTGLTSNTYLLRVAHSGHATLVQNINTSAQRMVITLAMSDHQLDGVTVRTQRPFIEVKPGRTIVNVDASISNAGATVMEALEKLPGVSIDRDGNLSLKGRTGARIFIDGKPAYLSGAELAAVLSGLNASQLAQVELMDVPPSSYDAEGNAGIINLKFKKALNNGFNGTISSSLSQGRYTRTNEQLLLNYRTGNINYFLNYGFGAGKSFSRLYSVRDYNDDNGNLLSQLDQPSRLYYQSLTHSLRTGIDYSIGAKTTLGLTLTGMLSNKSSTSNNVAYWKRSSGLVDSVIRTRSLVSEDWKHSIASLHFAHRFNSSSELSADADLIDYHVSRDQAVENLGVFPTNSIDSIRANIPTDIEIFSAKVDYTTKLKATDLAFGWKFSQTGTDNLADYYQFDGWRWRTDYGRSNHFLYNETINAFYATAQSKLTRFALQGGLRYEATSYNARQLAKDSSFSRRYNSLFPTLSISFEKDSANSFSLIGGRRITRPYFQKLNPFLFVINKYTYQQGNPYFLPEFTWNLELSHVYKNRLISTISYSTTRDYHAQIFPMINDNIIVYTEGNLGRLHNYGASITWQQNAAAWWSFSLQGLVNHKKMNGVVLGRFTTAEITQYTFNLNNQFRFGKGWNGEVSAFYNSKSQHDLQEIVNPYGQLTLGVAKVVAQNKGTLKLTIRDLLYTNQMRGLSYFSKAVEAYNLSNDSRFVQLSFSWRFGKAYKSEKRSDGAAGDELQRIGND